MAARTPCGCPAAARATAAQPTPSIMRRTSVACSGRTLITSAGTSGDADLHTWCLCSRHEAGTCAGTITIWHCNMAGGAGRKPTLGTSACTIAQAAPSLLLHAALSPAAPQAPPLRTAQRPHHYSFLQLRPGLPAHQGTEFFRLGTCHILKSPDCPTAAEFLDNSAQGPGHTFLLSSTSLLATPLSGCIS